HVRLRAGRAEFLEGDTALRLQADIDDGEFVGEADDAAGDDRAVEAAVTSQGFIEERGKVLAHEMVLGRSRRDGAGGGGCCHMEVVFRDGCPRRGPGGCRWCAHRPWWRETRLARGLAPRAGLKRRRVRSRGECVQGEIRPAPAESSIVLVTQPCIAAAGELFVNNSGRKAGLSDV